MKQQRIVIFGIMLAAWGAMGETLPPLVDGKAPQSIAEAWGGFDPRAEPLESEVLREWEEDGVVLRVLRYRVGVFKGSTARMAAVYGFPKGAKGVPGLVQIHGGGQYADYRAVLTNARRGYATISISWAGRISAPGHGVNPDGVKRFWAGKTDDPEYRLTTDWGAVDAYHAPSREAETVFPSAKPGNATIDAVESPRNSPWFLCALGARRALTFLERQPEVDPKRLGVYGHSMGGKLTVMAAAADDRVKAAAPSCGGISDRENKSELFVATIGDAAQLRTIRCPIVFLSPANDFHGRINDLPRSIAAIQTDQWRVVCAPHHNHQDTAEHEVATQLWFDQHLKGNFRWPSTPMTTLQLKTDSGTPQFSVAPDGSGTVREVRVFYTQQGIDSSARDLHHNRINQYWHYAKPILKNGRWIAQLPLESTAKPLWVYANVSYQLDAPVSGAGYYYGSYVTDRFTVSSLVEMLPASALQEAGSKVALRPSRQIESFEGDWRRNWFTYKTEQWPIRTHKIYNDLWRAPDAAKLALEVRSEAANTLLVGVDGFVAEVKLNGGAGWQSVSLGPEDFSDGAGEPLASWQGIKELRLGHEERLRHKGGNRKVGGAWKGAPPVFRDLRWQVE